MALQANRLVSVLIEQVAPPFAVRAISLTGWHYDLNAVSFRSTLAAIERRVSATTRSSATTTGSSPPETQEPPPVPPASPKPPRNRLFLCYRRDDTEDATGRLHDRLANAYGDERLFMDIDSVPLGVDFVDHVSEQISRCCAVIVMIGRRWLSMEDRRGRRRLDLDDDLVRAEVAAALEQAILVIPVLVQDAEMPLADDLPDEIRPRARRNGISVSAARWRTDVERLITELDRVMKPSRDSSKVR
jgi:hypothetical protein